jgi:hypothetical protein
MLLRSWVDARLKIESQSLAAFENQKVVAKAAIQSVNKEA